MYINTGILCKKSAWITICTRMYTNNILKFAWFFHTHKNNNNSLTYYTNFRMIKGALKKKNLHPPPRRILYKWYSSVAGLPNLYSVIDG